MYTIIYNVSIENTIKIDYKKYCEIYAFLNSLFYCIRVQHLDRIGRPLTFIWEDSNNDS